MRQERIIPQHEISDTREVYDVHPADYLGTISTCGIVLLMGVALFLDFIDRGKERVRDYLIKY